MPSSPRPARGLWGAARRRPRLAAAAAVAVVVAALLAILLPGRGQVPRTTGCMAASGGQQVPLTPGQAGIAATIAGVASSRQLPARAVAVAYATALQESKLTNLHYGDLDSVGVFQQRPSQGWGTARELEDPVYATRKFFGALVAVHGYQRLPISAAAQAVQRSADGSAYAQYARTGTVLASAFTGTEPHAVWCSYAGPPGGAGLAAASTAVNRTFGLHGRRTGPALQSVDVGVGASQQGWAVASWLVANAGSYDISWVRYAGYQWAGHAGPGRWAAQPGGARTAGSAASVEFG